jgi:hypothetical protein
MKAYKDLPEKNPSIVSEPAVAYGVQYGVVQAQQYPPAAPAFKIPCDENGVPIGTPWEVIRERMYDNLSKHYGVDLRTL